MATMMVSFSIVLSRTLWFKVETQLELYGWRVNLRRIIWGWILRRTLQYPCALSMANAGPNTNGSQFFIVQNQHLPYSKKEIARGGWPEPIAEIYANQGGTPHLDRRHTVFWSAIWWSFLCSLGCHCFCWDRGYGQASWRCCDWNNWNRGLRWKSVIS